MSRKILAPNPGVSRFWHTFRPYMSQCLMATVMVSSLRYMYGGTAHPATGHSAWSPGISAVLKGKTALCTTIPHRSTIHSQLHTDRPPSVPQYHTDPQYTASCTLTDRSLYRNTTPLHNTPPAAH